MTLVWLLLITNWHTPVELAVYQSEATCVASSKQILEYTKALPSTKPTVYSVCVPISPEGRLK